VAALDAPYGQLWDSSPNRRAAFGLQNNSSCRTARARSRWPAARLDHVGDGPAPCPSRHLAAAGLGTGLGFARQAPPRDRSSPTSRRSPTLFGDLRDGGRTAQDIDPAEQTGYVDFEICRGAGGSAKVAIMLAGDLRDLGGQRSRWPAGRLGQVGMAAARLGTARQPWQKTGSTGLKKVTFGHRRP
jgi:hypothetical protein